MEASTVAPVAVGEPAPSHDGRAEATRSTSELFQWSGYVHVGAGAEECEHRIDGQCPEGMRVDPETGHLAGHFHAWVCLPNPYQIRDINDKARAARARKVRALRDPESDSHAVLEGELDELRRRQWGELLRVIASRAVEEHLFDIIEEVKDDDRFENQAQDAEELARLREVPEDERSSEQTEEIERLEQDMLDYGEAMNSVIKAREGAELRRLESLPADDVIDIEREYRIKQIADEVFLHTYYTWTIYTCAREPTLDGSPVTRKFKDPHEQHRAAPEVLVALRAKVNHLEQATTRVQRGDAAGNS